MKRLFNSLHPNIGGLGGQERKCYAVRGCNSAGPLAELGGQDGGLRLMHSVRILTSPPKIKSAIGPPPCPPDAKCRQTNNLTLVRQVRHDF
jgi:hypothetical protein